MEDKFQNIRQKIQEEIKSLKNEEEWQDLKIHYLGRKGVLADLMKQVKSVSAEQRPKFGKRANALKKEIEHLLSKHASEKESGSDILKQECYFDASAPGKKYPLGSLHPVTQMMHHIWDVFKELNFEVVQGPEIENDYYNFDALNEPPDHPARDMQDTFFLPNKLLLRTQTTSVDIRKMELRKPPIRIITTGKTYRRDSDITHTPMFHQFDGAVVDKNITMEHLKGTLHAVMERLLEAKLKVRFRISYFPFVEPGAEFDVSCTICNQKGCPTCKYSGWIEMGGCGMLHPNVLKNVGYDPKSVQGYAFGFGIERPIMVKHKISDLRLFFENDIRFLEQFS